MQLASLLGAGCALPIFDANPERIRIDTDAGHGVGKPVGKLRLQAFPRATMCLACKEIEERRAY